MWLMPVLMSIIVERSQKADRMKIILATVLGATNLFVPSIIPALLMHHCKGSIGLSLMC